MRIYYSHLEPAAPRASCGTGSVLVSSDDGLGPQRLAETILRQLRQGHDVRVSLDRETAYEPIRRRLEDPRLTDWLTRPDPKLRKRRRIPAHPDRQIQELERLHEL